MQMTVRRNIKNQPLNVVWFKRDLRVHDHRPLYEAAKQGNVLPLFIVEPQLWLQPDYSGRHWDFVCECLADLRNQLASIGQPLIVRKGNATETLAEFHNSHGIASLWSHEETGNDWTFQRDRSVAAWCSENGIQWHEFQQNGTIRRLKNRDGWSQAWDHFMAMPKFATPGLNQLHSIEPGEIPVKTELGLGDDRCPDRQIGGRETGLKLLKSFLHERGEQYRKETSNPLAGAKACSRISPYLAWGSLSMREAAQATWKRQSDLKASTSSHTKNWQASMRSFSGRLHWHCHFIQKLEDEPRLEFENLHSAYDNIRPRSTDQARLAAWQNGETGLPFVDACMRSLAATGWLNFRMRAMVTAVASYHLWLDWRQPGLYLAQLFTDYEPGIHWSQIQMQSGTTGMNTVRIYNPIKQGYDQDPNGIFIRKWIPELKDIKDRYLQEPWKADNAGSVLNKVYPFPIIDHMGAAREARQKIWAVRRGEAFWAETSEIVSKHASRKSGSSRRRRPAAKKANGDQLTLHLGEVSKK